MGNEIDFSLCSSVTFFNRFISVVIAVALLYKIHCVRVL